MEWVSVKETPPEDDQECLIAFKHYEDYVFDLGTYRALDESFISWNDFGLQRDITHWMPLPEPPKDE